MDILLGYCCISTLHEELRCNRASTKTHLEKLDGPLRHDSLVAKGIANLEDLCQLMKENVKQDIFAYRVPEQLLPQIDLGYYNVSEFDKKLKEVGEVANSLGYKLSNHPSQYFVLNSLKESVVEKTIRYLDLFADVLERMTLDVTPSLVLHIGGKGGYTTKQEAVMGFCTNFKRLSEAARKYLVIENDNVSFTVEDCLLAYEEVGIPVVFDNKHYEWNSGNLSFEEAVKYTSGTWGEQVPKFHLSSDKEGNKHAHSEYIDPVDYNRLRMAIIKAGIQRCYVMLECKEKDKAIIKLRVDTTHI